MTAENDGMTILLANRSYLYKLLQRIFGDEPSGELLEIAANSHTRESLRLILDQEEHKFDTYLNLFTEWKQKMSDDAKGTLDKLQSEYTALFIGPNKLPAPPWESVYLTKERLLFQESTLKVRRIYLGYHFLPRGYPHEADDHLALELDFMAHLAGLALECFQEEKDEELKKLLLDQKAFLEEHLLAWIGKFAEQIQQSNTHYFYPQMAALTEQVLKIDSALMEELISTLS